MSSIAKNFGALLIAACTGPLLAQTSSATPADIQRHIQRIQSGLVPALIGRVVLREDQPHLLSERMSALHVPGVSIAVIHHGALEWAQGFGVTRVGGPPVTAETLFQAGSISKPVTAMAALHLVQQEKLSLDADINSVLTSWKLPENPIENGKPITLRELLTHTGGITVHGFPGYANDAPIPTLIQVLNGEQPANTPAIRVEAAPGTKWTYSGGGYTIVQQMLLDVSKQPFAVLMHDTVLAPIGMTHSTYQQPLPPNLQSISATPYDSNNRPIVGGAHVYPEMAAAGLWTTPSDLARYALEVSTSLQGKSNHVLSPEMTAQMLTPGVGDWGLGVQIGGSVSKRYFMHGGVNDGFESILLAYEQGGDGAVVMTNAQGGSVLAAEIMQSIAAEYDWPDYRPIVLYSLSSGLWLCLVLVVLVMFVALVYKFFSALHARVKAARLLKTSKAAPETSGTS